MWRNMLLAATLFAASFGHTETRAAEAGGDKQAQTEPAQTEQRQTEQQPLYLRIETPPAPVLSATQALATFRTAPGFVIEPVAVEPLVEDPVAVTWDEQGKLYVVEMRGYMPDLDGNGEDEPIGEVVRLHDDNADGVFDRREIILDKLILPRAVAVVNEGLLIAEPPNLWLCPNTDGSAASIDCSKKRSLGTYGNQPGSVEHAENGLLIGLDNWIYSAKSTQRLRIVDGQLVAEPTLFRGQWGITQDDWGRLFYNTNSKLLLGDSYSAQAVVASGNRGGPGLGAPISQGDRLHAIRVNTGVNRAYVSGVLREDGRLNQPTSASGMAVYRADALGDAFNGQVFVAEPAANAVVQLQLEREGLKTVGRQVLYPDPDWQQREFLASTDERFRPVDVKVGPDGALYVIDMYRGVIQDHVFLSPELRAQAEARGLQRPLGMGRIWRVRPADMAAKDTTQLVDEPVPWKDLVAHLSHSNGWWRDTAQRLLQGPQYERKRALRGTLSRLAQDENPRAASHALWTLEGRGELSARIVRKALSHSAVEVRVAALEAGASLLKDAELLALADAVDDPRLRQQWLLSLASRNAAPAVLALLAEQLLVFRDDPYVLLAVQAAAVNREYDLARNLLLQQNWSQADEAATKVVQKLASQSLRNTPHAAESWLSLAEQQRQAAPWQLQAVLEGLFEVSRDNGFQRVVLAAEHPLFNITEPDLWTAISRARRAFTWPGDDLAADAKPLTPAQQAQRTAGRHYYESFCATCHGADGNGIAGLGPTLVDSEWVTGPLEVLGRIVLHGLSGPITVKGESWNSTMPGHGMVPAFNDDVAAGLLTHLRRSWGHAGRAAEADFVAGLRAGTADRTQPWTAPELAVLDVHTHYAMYEGQYGGIGFVYTGQGLEVRSGIFNGALEEVKEDHFLFAPRQILFEFLLDETGQVTGVRMQTPEGAMVASRQGPRAAP